MSTPLSLPLHTREPLPPNLPLGNPLVFTQLALPHPLPPENCSRLLAFGGGLRAAGHHGRTDFPQGALPAKGGPLFLACCSLLLVLLEAVSKGSQPGTMDALTSVKVLALPAKGGPLFLAGLLFLAGVVTSAKYGGSAGTY